MGFLGKLADRVRDDGADVRHPLQLFEGGIEHARHRAQMARDGGRRLLADVADAERVNQPGQVVLLAPLDLRDHVASDLSQLARDGAVGPRLARRDDEVLERGRLEVIKVREVVHEPLLDQLIDERLAQPFDVHRRTRREVLEAAPQPRRAGRVLAPPHHFFLVAPQRASAHRTRRGHRPRLRVIRTQAEHRRDHPRDDVARFLDDDRVARADILARDVLGVVQRGHRDRGARKEDRLEDRIRRDRAGASDVDVDSLNLRMRLLCRELERRRPPWKLRGRPEPLAQCEVVDFHDDPVRLEVERSAFLRPFGAERDHVVDGRARLPVPLDGQAPRSHGRQCFRVGREGPTVRRR